MASLTKRATRRSCMSSVEIGSPPLRELRLNSAAASSLTGRPDGFFFQN